MKYTDLDLDHKKEFLTNCKALYMVFALLVEAFDNDEYPIDIWRKAYSEVAVMSPKEIEDTIQALEARRHLFETFGMPVAVDLARMDIEAKRQGQERN